MAPKYHVLPISGAIAHNELVYQFIVYSTISSHIKFYNEVSPGVSEYTSVYEMSFLHKDKSIHVLFATFQSQAPDVADGTS